MAEKYRQVDIGKHRHLAPNFVKRFEDTAFLPAGRIAIAKDKKLLGR